MPAYIRIVHEHADVVKVSACGRAGTKFKMVNVSMCVCIENGSGYSPTSNNNN